MNGKFSNLDNNRSELSGKTKEKGRFMAIPIKRLLAFAIISAIFICSAIAGIIAVAKNNFDTASAASSHEATASANENLSLYAEDDFAISWQKAVNSSIQDKTQVTFTLGNDWVADAGETAGTTSFGNGDGFLNGQILVPEGADIYLNLGGHKIDRNLGGDSSKAIVDGGVIVVHGKLTIINGTITGGSNTTIGGGVYVGGENIANASFTMEENAVITANYTNRNGGGIFVYENSTFVMNGGMIGGENDTAANTAAEYGGGVYLDKHVKATLNKGTISYNEATDYDGGGIYVAEYATLTMDNVTISHNSSKYGGGVSSHGTFTMNNGIVSNNHAEIRGGGVRARGGTFTLNDGLISENTASANGGGVSLSGVFLMNGGAIESNTATIDGGGVYVGTEVGIGTFIFTKGTITNGNKANRGGGVFINSNGLFNLSGSVDISGNVTQNSGNNNNVYLVDEKAINITGALTGSKIYITVANKEAPFTSDYSKYNSEYPMKYFFNDDSNGGVVLKATSENVKEAYLVDETVLMPVLKQSVFTYDGSQKNVELVNADHMTLSGATFGTAAVNFEVTVTFTQYSAGNYLFPNGSTSFPLAWRIDRAEITLPTLSKTSETYSSNAVNFTISIVENMSVTLPEAWSISGTTVTIPAGANAADYEIKFTPDNNHCWAGGSTDARTIYWKIERAKIDVPTLSKFNNVSSKEELRVDISSVAFMNIKLPEGWVIEDGTVVIPANIAAGDYSISFTPDENHCWTDGTTDERTSVFTIYSLEIWIIIIVIMILLTLLFIGLGINNIRLIKKRNREAAFADGTAGNGAEQTLSEEQPQPETEQPDNEQSAQQSAEEKNAEGKNPPEEGQAQDIDGQNETDAEKLQEQSQAKPQTDKAQDEPETAEPEKEENGGDK